MEAIESIKQTIYSQQTLNGTQDKVKLKSGFWEMAEFNRIGFIAFVLSIVACTSAIVTGFFVDGDNQFQLTLMVVPTMATLLSILVVAPMRWILGIGIAAMLINLVVIFI